jgi:hypothetical protein
VALPLAGVLALTVAGTGSAAPQGEASAKIPNCVEATNLESIVDDSGSMSGSDGLNGRRQLIEILADLNRDMIFGGVEFGTNANALFPPTVATQGKLTPAIANGLLLIQADNGSTDYNDGFNLANAQNPAANARLFLSDGEHNAGPYQNGHRTPLVKTYVVGFGSIDPTILNVIAVETGGPILVVNSSTDILAAALKVSNALNCEEPPIERTLQFNAPQSSPFVAESAKKKKRKGQSKKVAFRPNGKTAQVVVSHGTAGSVLKAVQFKQGKKGVKRSVTRGDNYVTVNLRRLKKGKVRYQVQAKKLAGPTTAVVQMTP